MIEMKTTIKGQLLIARTSTFENDKKEVIEYGKIQLMIRDMSGDFYAIQNIKCKRENFGWLDDLQKHYGKNVELVCDCAAQQNKMVYTMSMPYAPAPAQAKAS